MNMLTMRFKRDKETKNTVRFKEVLGGDLQRGFVDQVYLAKAKDDEFGKPTEITVTIEPG
jgi:hypothetical protein